MKIYKTYRNDFVNGVKTSTSFLKSYLRHGDAFFNILNKSIQFLKTLDGEYEKKVSTRNETHTELICLDKKTKTVVASWSIELTE